MASRKLSDFDLESCMEPRTRPRLELEPLGFRFPPPPPSQPPLNTMFLYIQPPPPPPPLNKHQEPGPETELTMYSYRQKTPPPPQLPVPPPPHATAPRRLRKKPTHAPRQDKPLLIPPPYPWATDRRARVHSLKTLTETLMIKTVFGDVSCKRCQKTYQIEYDLVQKNKEVFEYMAMNGYNFRDRAPPEWMSPVLPRCKFCNQENCMKPVAVKKKKMINWLFLFLGQMIGCCTLEQLKYFCKHTGNHRTGAKDRLLFLTYVELCKQVNGQADR